MIVVDKISFYHAFGTREMLEALYPIARKKMQAAVDYANRDLDARLSRPGRGKSYRSHKGGGEMHRASRAGSPPAPDTHNYRKSIRVKLKQAGAYTVEIVVESRFWKVYGRRLEYGGMDRRGVYIAPRPHMRPMIDRVHKFITKNIMVR